MGAHVYNYETLVSSWLDSDPATNYLNMFEDDGVRTRLNPVRNVGLDPIVELLSTVAGVTGIVITGMISYNN